MDKLCSERRVYVKGVKFKLCTAVFCGQCAGFNLNVGEKK